MKSIVLELQRDALNKDTLVTDLLRKAFVVARKLKINEFENWISKELEGYSDNSEIPGYREIAGEVKGWNPHHGWLPVYIQDTEMAELFSKRESSQCIAEIESLLINKDKDSCFHMPFNHEREQIICKAINTHTQITLETPHTGLVRILNAVRNIILNWALKLEEDGVMGEGMTFSEDEKKEVEKHSYNINNFYGEVTGTQIQQDSSKSEQNIKIKEISIESVGQFIDGLKNELPNIDLKDNANKELAAELTTIEAQITSPNPKTGIVKESLNSIQRILEGASGGAIAQLLMNLGNLF